MRISDATFVVVDTETLGRSATKDRVVEIGAVKVHGGRITDQFEELINPECAVPQRITRLTGISTAMVFDRRVASDVLADFEEFLADAVFVAHNLSFDLGILNRERRRAGRPVLANQTLCTVRLARRLLPGLRSKKLSSVADLFGIRIRRHHRALPDAEATAEILLRFLDQLDLEFGVESLADLLAFQRRRYGAINRMSANVSRIRDEVLDALPASPGVYFMKDGSGKVLYVGKAQDLSTRVRSYFTAVEGHAPRIRQMIRAVRDVGWEEAESELDALILESRLIKKMQPAYNRAQRQYFNRPFIRIDVTHDYPRVSWSAFLHDDGAEYYGPLSDRSEAIFIVDLINRFFRLRECDDDMFARGRRCVYASLGRCIAPCELGESGVYLNELERVRAFLAGSDGGITEQMQAAMRAASAEMDYEQAGIYRDWMAKLDRILSKREPVASRVLDHNAVVVHRRAKKSARLLIVSRGRHVDTLRVDQSEPAKTMRKLDRKLNEHFLGPPETTVYKEREIDELYLLSHWLYVHRNETHQVQWRSGDSILKTVDEVASLIGAGNCFDANGLSSRAQVDRRSQELDIVNNPITIF